MAKYLSILLMLLISLTTLSSCGDDDNDSDEPGNPTGTSTLTFNGVKVGKMLSTLCEISGSPKEIVFEAHFNYGEEGLTSFNLAVPSIKSISELENGMELADDITIYKFYSSTGAFVGHKRYEAIDGSIKVQSVTSKEVVLKFNNFEFIRELGDDEQTFKVNGSITYKIND